MILAQRFVNKMRMDESAAVYIQSVWRKHRVSSWYKNLRQSIITLQAHSRGYLARQQFTKLKNTVIITIKIVQLNLNKTINYNIFRERVFQHHKLPIPKNLVKKNFMTLSN